MADYADDSTLTPPKELIYAWRIEKWGPPWAGGWMKWPAGLMLKMTACLNVYNAVTGSRSFNGSLAEFASVNPDAFERIVAITKLRQEVKKSKKLTNG